MIHTGGGKFDPNEGNVYFLASGHHQLEVASRVHEHLLIAVNEIGTKAGKDGESVLDKITDWIDNGDKKLFIDSGIFNLTNEHMRKHDITMDEALSLPPDKIDGFDELLEKYLLIIRQLEDKCWGYIELDQGGRENKIKTRAMLENKYGLKPIPVYHPLNDGWDYFDYLAERYDRICFGNVVQADATTRLRLVATAWERHRKYPHLWIHFLGLTPNSWLYAMPMNSGDSSSWLSAVRWNGYNPNAAGKTQGVLPKNFRYVSGDIATEKNNHKKAVSMAAYGASFIQKNWRQHIRDIEELGFDIYPENKEN